MGTVDGRAAGEDELSDTALPGCPQDVPRTVHVYIPLFSGIRWGENDEGQVNHCIDLFLIKQVPELGVSDVDLVVFELWGWVYEITKVYSNYTSDTLIPIELIGEEPPDVTRYTSYSDVQSTNRCCWSDDIRFCDR